MGKTGRRELGDDVISFQEMPDSGIFSREFACDSFS